jgi:hypothetical protein
VNFLPTDAPVRGGMEQEVTGKLAPQICSQKCQQFSIRGWSMNSAKCMSERDVEVSKGNPSVTLRNKYVWCSIDLSVFVRSTTDFDRLTFKILTFPGQQEQIDCGIRRFDEKWRRDSNETCLGWIIVLAEGLESL